MQMQGAWRSKRGSGFWGGLDQMLLKGRNADDWLAFGAAAGSFIASVTVRVCVCCWRSGAAGAIS